MIKYFLSISIPCDNSCHVILDNALIDAMIGLSKVFQCQFPIE